MKIIHDGDHGGDDFAATLFAVGCPDVFDLQGVVTCHGNISVEQAGRNACACLELAGRADVPVHIGASTPIRRCRPGGDDAFGGNGIGGVEMPSTTKEPCAEPAAVWLKRELSGARPLTTLCVTGPLTNVATLLEHPECRSGIERIVVMGGCLGPLGPFQRCGNITPHAEFNFYMDPEAADYVLGSGIPVTLLPMDATHQLVLTEDRKRAALNRWNDSSGEKVVRMLSSVEHLDREKFELPGAVIHDLHVFAYLAAPKLYQTFESGLRVVVDPGNEQRGRLLTCGDRPPVTVVGGILNPDRVFEEMVTAVANSLC